MSHSTSPLAHQSPTPPLIEVNNLHKSYGATVAVAGVSFHVAAGEILGLVGPNGAGKTTTLRAIAGILPASRGALTVAGHDVEDEPVEAKRQLAYVPDDPQLFHDLTVAEHLAFTASVYRVCNATEAARRLVERFQLTDKFDSCARDLSRGMRQKLAICCAYLHEPIALLFDEPLTGLDPHGIRTLKHSIRQRAQHGAAVIVSSHLLALVEDLCSHVMILDSGQQKYFGPIDALRETYRTSQQDTSLEDIFFQATDGSAAAVLEPV